MDADDPSAEGAVEREAPIGREAPPTMPSRRAFLVSFLSVVTAGLFGGVIGYGLVDISSSGASGAAKISGTIIGAGGAALGVGIVAVLVLRAMAEWRRDPTPRSGPRRSSA